jgi:hypothetical protein
VKEALECKQLHSVLSEFVIRVTDERSGQRAQWDVQLREQRGQLGDESGAETSGGGHRQHARTSQVDALGTKALRGSKMCHAQVRLCFGIDHRFRRSVGLWWCPS